MSETYPPEGNGPSGEPAPPTAPPQPPGSQPPQPPQPPGMPLQPPGMPLPPKRKLDWPFAVLGFVTPIAAWLLTAGLTALFPDTSGTFAPALGLIASALSFGLFAAMLACLIVGRNRDNNRLRSFGIGGLAYYAVTVLLGLLLFGACFLLLARDGGGGYF